MSTSRTNASPRGYSLDKLQSCQSRVEVLDATNFLPLSDTNPPSVSDPSLSVTASLRGDTPLLSTWKCDLPFLPLELWLFPLSPPSWSGGGLALPSCHYSDCPPPFLSFPFLSSPLFSIPPFPLFLPLSETDHLLSWLPPRFPSVLVHVSHIPRVV